MEALSSKPSIRLMELKYIQSMMTMMVPIDPYTLLYALKLFTQYENPRVVANIKKVDNIDPGDSSGHFSLICGAYL